MPFVIPPAHRRPLAFVLLAVLGTLVGVGIAKHKKHHHQICHPNLAHLRHSDGREVLLIGTLPLDLDGTSKALVKGALKSLGPDIVMVEGTATAGVTAMMISGGWEFDGAPPRPGLGDWKDTGDALPVVLQKEPKKRGWFEFGSRDAAMPDRSMVPVKVSSWANHLRGSVGGELAAAVSVAAAAGVPVHFLGPQDGGLQGHFQVYMLARQAALELIEEEQRRGSQMANSDMDAALLRAEEHIRKDGRKWLVDSRTEASRLMALINEKLPPNVREQLTHQLEERATGIATRVNGTMEAHRRGAVVLSVDSLYAVEGKLKEAGYQRVSQCT